jgi:hypothetical protein
VTSSDQSSLGESRTKTVTAPTLGALALCFMLTSAKDTPDYRAGQNGMFGFVTVFSGLFLTRLVSMGHVPLPRSVRDERWRTYARTGACAVDAAFLLSAGLFLMFADRSYWKDFSVRAATVAVILVVRLLAGVVHSVLRRDSA